MGATMQFWHSISTFHLNFLCLKTRTIVLLLADQRGTFGVEFGEVLRASISHQDVPRKELYRGMAVHPDPSYAEVARQTVDQAVLSVNGKPPFARQASEVIPRLFISDVFTAHKLDTLRELSITHIITVMEHIVLFPIELELKTLHVRLDDLASADLLSHLSKTTEFIADALKDENARVLVHCWQGISRSASVAAAFLIARDNKTTDEAIGLLKSKRRIIQPNTGFIRQLKQYEILLRADDGQDYSMK